MDSQTSLSTTSSATLYDPSTSSLLEEVLSLDRLRIHELLRATPESALQNPILSDLFATVQAYIVEVQPKSCSLAIKALGDLLPLHPKSEVLLDPAYNISSISSSFSSSSFTSLNHLKRVRRRAQIDSVHDLNNKRKKPPMKLELLLSTTADFDGLSDDAVQSLSQHVDLSKRVSVPVPLHPPHSSVMLTEGNKLWPQVFHYSTSEEQREGEKNLESSDWSMMEYNATSLWKEHGAAIVDPSTNKVISLSTAEMRLQEAETGDAQRVYSKSGNYFNVSPRSSQVRRKTYLPIP